MTYLIACTKDSCNNVGLKSSSSLSVFVSAMVLHAKRSTNSSASNGSLRTNEYKCFQYI